MILSIESDLPTFKPVVFHEGLNVILADKFSKSNDKKTRNSAGKTSLVEILSFMYGSKAETGTLLRNAALEKYTFRASLQIGTDRVEVSRQGKEASRIWMHQSYAAKLALSVKTDKKNGQTYISNQQWKEVLGHRLFGFPPQLSGTEYSEPYTPGFRSIFGYFVRRDNSGGFISPEKSTSSQSRWDYQENLSYILGLDWRIPFELQRVRERERSLEELKKAAAGGTLGSVIGTVAELRPTLAVAESKARELRKQLKEFRVLDSYSELSDRASRAKAEMQAIERRAVSLKETLLHLKEALKEEASPKREDVTRVYKAIGIELPETVRRRFEHVEQFHMSVVENRREHLKDEILSIEAQVEAGEAAKAALDAERSEILRNLEGSGALEDFLALQKRLAALDAEAASLQERFKAAEMLEGESTELDIDRANIKKKLQTDHTRKTSRLNAFTLLISKAIHTLYEDRTGGFVVEATNNGPEFRISIQGDQGGGIAHMEIFCFDLALFTIMLEQKKGPGFLVHDSHLFDGVDERQVARALVIGADLTKSLGGQYIVTMNSDIFDRLPFPADFDREAVVAKPRLSDVDPAGGLFGFQF
ncbi:MAG: ABC-three component system protein [Rhodomicrobium sp.]